MGKAGQGAVALRETLVRCRDVDHASGPDVRNDLRRCGAVDAQLRSFGACGMGRAPVEVAPGHPGVVSLDG